MDKFERPLVKVSEVFDEKDKVLKSIIGTSKTIEKASVAVTPPVVGEHPDLATAKSDEPEKYTVKFDRWWDTDESGFPVLGSLVSPHDVFEDGHIYLACVWITPQEGYAFDVTYEYPKGVTACNTAITINDEDGLVVSVDDGTGALWCSVHLAAKARGGIVNRERKYLKLSGASQQEFRDILEKIKNKKI
jgi:hypothetical protein